MLGPIAISLPNSVVEMISRWQLLYPYDLSKKNLLKTTWMWIPKFLSWKIWLERNNRIFKEESRVPAQIAVKARVMLSEALNTKALNSNMTPLSAEEERWFKEFKPTHHSIEAINSPHKTNWEIRLAEMDFIKWRSALDEWCLFFDGASKGNLGQAGGGGIIFEATGNLHLSYAWGLGHQQSS